MFLIGIDTVSVDLWNISGATVTLGSIAISISVLPITADSTQVTKTVSVGAVEDGDILVATTLTVPGAAVGSYIPVASTPALPTGLQIIPKVVATGIVTVEIWNLSGVTVTPGQVTFSAALS